MARSERVVRIGKCVDFTDYFGYLEGDILMENR